MITSRHYIVGTAHYYMGLEKRVFSFKSSTPMDEEALIDALSVALEGTGFSLLPGHCLCIEECEVYLFRDEEFSLPFDVEHVEEAISTIRPDHVLLIDGVGSSLLTAPKSSWKENINWITKEHPIPQNAKAWNGERWVNVSRLE